MFKGGYFGIFNALLLVVIPFSLLGTAKLLPPGTFALMVLSGVVLFVLELPFCCTCLTPCQQISKVLGPGTPSWVRFLVYVIAGTILIVLQVHEAPTVPGWAMGILVVLNSVLYLIAVFSPAKADDDEEAPRPADASRADNISRSDARAAREEGAAGGIAGALASNEAVQQAAWSAAKDPTVQAAAVKAAKENPQAVSAAVEAMRAEALRAARDV